jgi:hypothetical protein
MREFRITINYDNFYAITTVMAEDNVESIEKSILDKLGRNEIKFEKDGFRDSSRRKWITYEEVINDRRPLHYETVLGTRLAARIPEVRKG